MKVVEAQHVWSEECWLCGEQQAAAVSLVSSFRPYIVQQAAGRPVCSNGCVGLLSISVRLSCRLAHCPAALAIIHTDTKEDVIITSYV